MAYEAYWDDVTVALRLNGTLPVTCDKGNTITNVGVTLGSYGADSGGVAAQIDADTDYLLIPGGAINTFGTAPMSLCFTFTPSAVTGYKVLMAWGDYSWSTSTLAFHMNSGYLQFYARDAGDAGASSYTYNGVNLAVLTADTTYKVMLCRSGHALRIFVNGGLVLNEASFFNTSPNPGDPAEYSIGRGADIYIANNSWMEGGFRGSIDEFYLVKGVALESAPYTPAALFDMAGAPATGTASLPLEIAVKATGAPALPLLISTTVTGSAGVGIEVNVITAALASGAATVADSTTGAAVWKPVVELDGVDVTADVEGDITVEATEGAARVATFALVKSGSIDVAALVGQTVVIDIADSAGANRLRLFTGVVDLPAIDLQRHVIKLDCTDDLQNVVNAIDRASLATLIGGRWSKAVFDDAAPSWVVAQDRLSTVPKALDMNPYGQLRVTEWAAKATADLSFDASVILENTVAVDPAERSGIINTVDVAFGYRFPMAKRDAYLVQFEYMTNGFGPWVNAGNHFLLRSAVESAIENAGGAIHTITYFPLPTTAQIINNGTAAWIPNPATDPLLCLGFDAVITFDYTQEVEEHHALRVFCQPSVDALGALKSTMSGAIEGKTVDTVAAETSAILYQKDITTIPPIPGAATMPGNITASVIQLTEDTKRAAANEAMETLIDVAKVKIQASHRKGMVSAAVALHPLIDLDKTIALNADGVVTKGKVVRLTHTMNAAAAQAITAFDLALTRIDGLGLSQPETTTAATAGVADGVTAPAGAPVCVYNGLQLQDQSFTITFPAVSSAERDRKTVEIAADYNVPLVEDVLTITL